jgi:hypothetical protein
MRIVPPMVEFDAGGARRGDANRAVSRMRVRDAGRGSRHAGRRNRQDVTLCGEIVADPELQGTSSGRSRIAANHVDNDGARRTLKKLTISPLEIVVEKEYSAVSLTTPA